MLSVVAFGGSPQFGGGVDVDGVAVRIGLAPTAPPDFHPDRLAHRRSALLEVTAFSCNYRDRTFLLRYQQHPAGRFSPFGSEFAARVRAVGAEVSELQVGDRVVSDHHHTGEPLPAGAEVEGGIATNRSSRRLLVMSVAKLLRVPDTIDDTTAAAISLNAQTAYSMVRRLGVAADSELLITAASSNTSIFAIGAARAAGARVTVLTGSPSRRAELEAIGANDIVHVPHAAESAARQDAIASAGRAVGGFDAVIDPFYDIHLPYILRAIRAGGSYMTCGLLAQSPQMQSRLATFKLDHTLHDVMLEILPRNIAIVGNCIGLRSDLSRALDDRAAGRLTVPIDSVFGASDCVAFARRTFSDPGRFGKVVLHYGDTVST